MAVVATKGNLKQLEMRRANIAKREETRIADAEALREKLQGLTVKVDARVGEEGQLFGSVTAAMIADALKAQEDVDVDRKRIELSNPIRVAGKHTVSVSLYRTIKADMTVQVGDEPEVVDEAAENETEEEAAAVAVEDAQEVEAEEAAE